MAGKDISEDIPLNVGNPGLSGFWTNNSQNYDIAIGGLPFFMAPTDANPYQRETAPYRKDQFDSSKEPGEQSLTGWWIRSQSSFHAGTGINFYDPSSGEATTYRFNDSQGVNVWTKGQVNLLKAVTEGHVTTGPVTGTDHQHPNQHIRPIQWSGTNGVLLHDQYDVDKIFPEITVSITNKALTSNVATLTTSVAHGLTVGMTIVITGVDATFNGSYRITTVPTTTTFTYAKTATNVSSTAVSPAGSGVTEEVIHFIDYNSGSAEPIYGICDDGVNAYWVTNHVSGGANKLHMFKKPITGDSTTGETLPSLTGDITQMFNANGIVITYATLEFVKDRIIACINNAVYQIAPNASSIGTAIYTNPNTNYHYTSISASGPAIYTAGHSGIYSTIQKYTLTGSGEMPTMSQASVAAELPPGEIVQKLYYYLGYMAIGTSKGVRIAQVNDQDGSLAYGPLIFQSSQPVYDFIGRDRFLWCASGVGTDAGLVRIDLGATIEGEPLRFAYANDLQYTVTTGNVTTGVSTIGATDRIAFCTSYNSSTNGHVYIESANTLVPTGYLKTGAIRYGTLEPKNFKFIRGRGDYTYGAMDIQTVDSAANTYNIITYNTAAGSPESSTLQPEGPQEFISYKFTLSRSTSDSSLGPVFKGYQAKALPATKRQRLIQFPVWCYDVETDRYSVQTGYEGRAWERIQLLEDLEAFGDIVNIQDFTTGERVQGLIERINFTRKTPPSGKFDGFGGVVSITIRTVL
jgi:hypothetical protein